LKKKIKKRKNRKVEKKNNLKKTKTKGKVNKKKGGEESLWIIVVIHNDLGVGGQ